ncbi:MAG: phage terminase large subunit [Xanthobacteraceae bacterium]
MKLRDRDYLNTAVRTDLLACLHKSMQTLNPGAPFLENWHLEAIIYQLERIRRGEINRLIINLPPRSLKSILVSVVFPAFLLGHNPRLKIFGISYSNELAATHAAQFRSIVTSPWYRKAFTKIRIARMADSDVYTTSRGFRRATSVHATLTGLGGDGFIVDDPLKAADAQSDAVRTALNEWFSNTLVSRLDNKKTGFIIVVMQRVHLNDLTGHLTESSDDWTVLNLAAVAEEDEAIPIGDGVIHRRRAGEALHPEREPVDVLEKLRWELGSDLFSAQYQQAPVPPGGAMIRREWLRYYDSLPERTYRSMVIQSWDTAAKDGAQNDWSVCTTWLLHDGVYYLIDLVRGRFDYPRLKATAIAQAQRHKPRVVLIEDASTGSALAQELKPALTYPVQLVPIERDKKGRLYVQQAKFEAGLVRFPRGAAFLPVLEAELLAFPQGKTDDQVDSISQALGYKGSTYNLDNVY